MPKKEKTKDMFSCCNCCMSHAGLVHGIAGIGIGILLVYYLGLSNLMIWGWVFVAVGLIGHVVGKMK